MTGKSQADQLLEGMGQMQVMASTLAGFRKTLIEGGFSADAADDMVVIMLSSSQQQVIAKMKAQPQPFLRGGKAEFRLPGT